MPEANGSRKRSRLRIALYTAGLLIAAFVIPPFISLDLIHLDRFRARLIVSIGRSLGRKVSTGSVRLRLLPRPGFDISDFVVDDDPRYGPEPVLRAAEVRAHLRLASLWGGHLQIASLSLENASLNLVRGKDGTWNLGQLLLQAAQTPSAPTAKLKIEARPRFPYIEVSDGRINFKSGDEKKVFALKEAEFALWLASEDRWNMRLKARPMRSDQNLADTGTISVSGSFDRARSIDQIPFHLKVSIDGAQLGQLTRLIYGYDRGWHAGVHLLTEVRGTPTDFSSSTEATFSSFRRYDIATASNLDVRVRCAARHRHPGNAAGVFPQTEMECLLPL
ncbi:MAG TPA: AsmA family protein, partial [Terriglobales bacterium]